MRTIAVVGALVAAAAITVYVLTLSRGAGCVTTLDREPCTSGTGLDGARAVTVSPDGRNVYVAASGALEGPGQAGAVAVFDRADDGTLTQKDGAAGCVSDDGQAPCADGAALDGPRDVAVRPDGRNLYVAAVGALAVFDRAEDGTLEQKPRAAGCLSDLGPEPCGAARALGGANEVAVSADGANVYVLAGDAVVVFDRAADGTLTQKRGGAGCVERFGEGLCADGAALRGASSLAVSRDGASVYVAASIGDAVAVFDRGADGTLTQKSGPAACVSDTSEGRCADGTALDGANSVTVSPDGRSVYVSTERGLVAVFDRSADGTLEQRPGVAVCSAPTDDAPCVGGPDIRTPTSVTASLDGKSVYVSWRLPGLVAVFDRAANGVLRQKPRPAGCVADGNEGLCAVGIALESPVSVALSPDGASAYVAASSDGAVTGFDRLEDGRLSQKE